MSNHKLRADKECENCGYTVDIAYCSNCGQKNVQTRQSFWHLITHFAEDFTHYDSAFWKTIKYLLFRPAKLTIAYLQGYRQKYVAPVKLYIFISFVTFFLISLTGYTEVEDQNVFGVNEEEIKGEQIIEVKTSEDSLVFEFLNGKVAHTRREADSLRALPKGERIGYIEYKVARAILSMDEGSVTLGELSHLFINTLPKVLFLYMPIFAFWLWLFHTKKRWYYFDHGIFTLHYFSSLLLLFTLLRILGLPFKIFDIKLNGYLFIMFIIYSFFYFFKAHRKMYSENWITSTLKSLSLFIINMICIVVAVCLMVIYILLNIH